MRKIGLQPVEFWFDLSSPYAYFAALEIDDLAAEHGRDVLWRPFLLGVVYQKTGMRPLTEQPMRGEYALRDWARLARLRQIPFRLPTNFPLRTQAPARMFYAVESTDAGKSNRFARRLFEGAFGRGLSIDNRTVAAALGAEVGLDPTELESFAKAEPWKLALRERNDEAIANGVFGSPFIRVDGEGFWGTDRLPMVGRWLSTGGW